MTRIRFDGAAEMPVTATVRADHPAGQQHLLCGPDVPQAQTDALLTLPGIELCGEDAVDPTPPREVIDEPGLAERDGLSDPTGRTGEGDADVIARAPKVRVEITSQSSAARRGW